ncbi:hypothetical protein ACFX1T_002485 [Malus domestica]
MIFLVWNVRGASKENFVSTAIDLVKHNNVDVLVVVEPRISYNRAAEVIKQLNFSNSVVSEVVGFSGGIWVLWNDSRVSLTPILVTDQVISMFVDGYGVDSWIFSAVYGSPDISKRQCLCRTLYLIHDNSTLPWLVAGDFNCVLSADERYGGNPICNQTDFCCWFDKAGMTDMGFMGSKYTWVNKRYSGGLIKQRIDRAICNPCWRAVFPEAFVKHLPKLSSDHNHLLISLISNKVPRATLKPFRF